MTENKKKKKSIGGTVTVGMGNPVLDMKQFNKDAFPPLDDTLANEANAEASAPANADGTCEMAAEVAGGDLGGEAGGLSEEVLHASRLGINVELPPEIHLLTRATVNHFVEQLQPEEEFHVGYVTPVYFYKELWDAFTLFKCTEFIGWTGVDYIEAVPDVGLLDDEKNKRIEHSLKQIKDTADYRSTIPADAAYKDTADNGIHHDQNPGAGEYADFSAQYRQVNKTVARSKDAETILFYPQIGSNPDVYYLLDIKDGNGYQLANREDLEKILYPIVMKKAAKRGASFKDKVQKMLAIDAATVKAVSFDTEDKYETRSRAAKTIGAAMNGYHVEKPQVRALYTNQIYYISGTPGTEGRDFNETFGLNESADRTKLTEKRETKRYYIRPQDIFCANKADVLKALIEVSEAGENCSVYTLKNLDDHDDVHELTNNDIIYYYDNDVLYDKNHVMVMDYDLFIKHEEERKNLGKSPAAITKSEYDQEYDDRMTKNTFVEDLQGKINYNTLKLALDRGEEVDLGSSSSATDFDTFSDGGMYANTTYVAYVDKDKYILGSTNWSDDGGEGSDEEVEFNTFDELFNELYNIDFDQCNVDLDDEHRPEEPEILDNPFDQTFESYDIYGNKLTEAKEEEPKVCCICGEEYEGYGNNAEPYKTGYCCDACNLKFVIPARMQAMNDDKETDESLKKNSKLKEAVDTELDYNVFDLTPENNPFSSAYDFDPTDGMTAEQKKQYEADLKTIEQQNAEFAKTNQLLAQARSVLNSDDYWAKQKNPFEGNIFGESLFEDTQIPSGLVPRKDLEARRQVLTQEFNQLSAQWKTLSAAAKANPTDRTLQTKGKMVLLSANYTRGKINQIDQLLKVYDTNNIK